VPLFVDGVLIADEGGRGEPLLYGVTAIHVLTMGHGLYTILTEREPPALTFNRGSVRGKVAATAVSDGKLTAPGLGVVGRSDYCCASQRVMSNVETTPISVRALSTINR